MPNVRRPASGFGSGLPARRSRTPTTPGTFADSMPRDIWWFLFVSFFLRFFVLSGGFIDFRFLQAIKSNWGWAFVIGSGVF